MQKYAHDKRSGAYTLEIFLKSIISAIFLSLCFFTLPKETFTRKRLENFDLIGSFLVIIFLYRKQINSIIDSNFVDEDFDENAENIVGEDL